MKRTITILILSVFCFLKVLPQETKIIGIIDGNRQNNKSLRIVTFDYVSSIYDTLLSIDDVFWVKNFASAIDLQRNIFYVMEEHSVCGSPPKIVYAINMISHQIKPVADLNGYAAYDVYSLFYDMFNNSLIYKDKFYIQSYNLSTGENRLICSLDWTLSGVYGNVTTYNPIENKLLYLALKDTLDTYYIYSVYIDVSTGTIEKTLKFDHNVFSLSNLSCDILNNKYYAINSLNDSIVEFDPLTGQTFNIGPVCLDNWGQLNSQVPVFDYYNNTYIIPICISQNSNILPSLDIVNPNEKSSSCISFQQGMETDEHHLFSGKDIFLKLEDNKLIASKCDSYNWYLNGVEILNANTQFLFPPQSGFYKYSTNIGGEIYFSNEILYQPLGINSQIEDNEIQIYPNPVTDELNINFPLTFTGLKTLIMYDLYGTIVFSVKSETLKNSHKILSPPGVYYLKIIYDGNKVITKKVIVI
jgi:hypothetical protein